MNSQSAMLFMTLPFLLTANYAVADRQAGLGGPGGMETVSSEPLTFDVPEREPIDRWSLLREASLLGGDDDEEYLEGINDLMIADNEADQSWGVAASAETEPEENGAPLIAGGVQTVGESMKWDVGVARRLRRVSRPVAAGDRSESTGVISLDATNQVRVSDHDEKGLSPLSDDGRSLACKTVKITFKVDKYGKETTVKLIGNGKTVLSSVNEVAAYQSKTLTGCVQDGTYTLKLTDTDGICCRNGKGYYKLEVGGTQVAAGGYFIGSKVHTIKIGYDWESKMNSRDKEWLTAHNNRRRKYNGGAGYKALRWANSLADDAKDHAEYLAGDCKNADLTHAANVADGENLAKNQGHGEWGGLYAADKIMGRWVDNELTWPYPDNAHYTQVVWRASSYVGCGESVRKLGDGATCRVQVCRYAPPGNCQVTNKNWQLEAWKDETLCGEQCVTEGCYA